MLGCPEAGRESEADVVGERDRLLLVGEGLDGDDWAEDLLLNDPVALPGTPVTTVGWK